jgi:hypothetical protein
MAPVAALNKPGKSGALVVFTVRQNHARLARRDDIEPVHQSNLHGERA